MSDSIIAQVKRLAEAQKKWGTTSCFILDANINVRFNVNFPALLAHMQAQQAVVEAAQKVKHYLEHRTTCKYLWDGVEYDCGYIAASAALDAALSENTDVE